MGTDPFFLPREGVRSGRHHGVRRPQARRACWPRCGRRGVRGASRDRVLLRSGGSKSSPTKATSTRPPLTKWRRSLASALARTLPLEPTVGGFVVFCARQPGHDSTASLAPANCARPWSRVGTARHRSQLREGELIPSMRGMIIFGINQSRNSMHWCFSIILSFIIHVPALFCAQTPAFSRLPFWLGCRRGSTCCGSQVAERLTHSFPPRRARRRNDTDRGLGFHEGRLGRAMRPHTRVARSSPRSSRRTEPRGFGIVAFPGAYGYGRL